MSNGFNFEERIQRLTERHEALAESLEHFRLEQEALAAKHERLDERERQARQALLAGIAAYLQALGGEAGR